LKNEVLPKGGHDEVAVLSAVDSYFRAGISALPVNVAWNVEGVSEMLTRALDAITSAVSEFMGRIGWILILYCMAFGVSDVFLRYAMNQPSQWIGTTLQAAMVLLACAGGVYSLQHDSFVKLDLFYASARDRTKAILDILTAPFAILFLIILIWKGYGAAALSAKLNQFTPTAVPIPIYPIKSAIPLTGCLILLIVLKKFLRDVRIALGHQPSS
jgi:TRAP-type mannitol/chloroaromatic compound transport system permease small subunit